jgi:hypothetical protein
VILVTANFFYICDAWKRMFRKSIAAVLLFGMMAWAEVVLAPMLFMHAGHVHASPAMAEHAAHHHAMPADHACCPGIGKPVDRAALELAASEMPCQDEHRCCFRQGPQSVPAPVSTTASSEIAPAQIAEVVPAPDATSHISATILVSTGPPPGQLGMVLRV